MTRGALSLVPTHPDRAGGLGFLSLTVISFAPLLAAHGAMLAGTMANRIFFQGGALPDFKVELVVLGPVMLFMPPSGCPHGATGSHRPLVAG